jgi:hypothetical protein
VKSGHYTQQEKHGNVMGVFVVESGEYFWGGTKNHEERDNVMVTPCELRWKDVYN